MAKKCWIEKVKRKPKFKVRGYYRCQRCGRSRGTLRKFGLCHGLQQRRQVLVRPVVADAENSLPRGKPSAIVQWTPLAGYWR